MPISQIIKELLKIEDKEQEMNLAMVPKSQSPNGITVTINEKQK